jgi:holo-[acyl-carrier protein] synthase
MMLTGGAKKRLDDLTPNGMVAQINLSLTDETPMAHAMVVISAIPAPLSDPTMPSGGKAA